MLARRSINLRLATPFSKHGDKGDGCYRLDQGLLKVSLISPQVRERIIAIITPGAVVGDLSVIDGLPRSASVHALTNCELRFLSRSAFEIIASLAFLPVKARVAHTLLALAENLGEETDSGGVLIPRIITQGDIAAMAGVARENTSRILSEWERKKLVTKSSGAYWIQDKAKLRGEIDDESDRGH